jgi:hypothetical protein
VVGEKEREDWAHGLVCVCVWQDSNATTAIGAGDEAHPSGVDDGLNDNGPGRCRLSSSFFPSSCLLRFRVSPVLRKSAPRGLSPTLFPSRTPGARLRATIAAPPNCGPSSNPSLHLELLPPSPARPILEDEPPTSIHPPSWFSPIYLFRRSSFSCHLMILIK